MKNQTHTAFLGWKCLASGPLDHVLTETKNAPETENSTETLLFFDDQTGKQLDFDLRGTIQEVLDRLAPKPGPGRPKLGVTSREISLLPRHWEWLETQPQGASAALRRLVDEARKTDDGESETRARIDATGRVMSALGGNLPNFEEAYRALYARDQGRLESLIGNWPPDLAAYIRSHVPWW